MNIKITPNNLTRLEKIFEEAKYVLRFEKGTFNSGYCILEHKKVVVVNKFLNLEGRINTLLDILPTIQLEEELLTPESLKLYRQVLQSKIVADNTSNTGDDTTATPSPEQSDDH
ncbi:hypothetical protein KTO58_20910 [Chitinophaga pendula]|uniref:hypothetical protein n=1 Tax=Chitinophaga TaxID=79328 RepID=UPI000BB0780B|nr:MULTISPECIES: hypothetical protein [Chitinophaga]ASZ10903.1 hypothetical protein CK934_07895 [Chitinophaga sp. MD30]UCJ06111.1 hypothetical protein KTO58_20910 [Chitinophaga pendula]